MWHIWGRRGVHTGFWWENLREKTKDNIKKWICKKFGGHGLDWSG